MAVTLQDSSDSKNEITQQGTSGAAHVLEQSGSHNAAASVDVNTGISADVDAAVAAQAGLRLMGFAARESAAVAAVATIVIVHGATVAGGSSVVPIELAANASASAWFGPDGIDCASGLSIDVVAGTADVNLFYKVVA